MIYTTHLLFAFLVISGLSSYFHFHPSAESVVVILLGSLAPDLDHPSSYINRRSWRLFSLSALTDHRGWTHSLLGGVVLTFVFFLIARSSTYASFYFIFFLGYVSHLFLDSLNPSGVAWFWPRKKRYGIGIVKTGSMGESVIQVVLFCFVLFLFFKVGKSLLL